MKYCAALAFAAFALGEAHDVRRRGVRSGRRPGGGEVGPEGDIGNGGAPSEPKKEIYGVPVQPKSVSSNSSDPLPFSFGTEVGDISTAPNDDGSSAQIALPSPMLFYGELVSSAYQNTNGGVTFDNPYSTYTPELIPSTRVPPLVAIYWTDIDTRNGGDGINQLFVGIRAASGDLETATDLVAQTGRGGFSPTSILVATWNEVEAYSRRAGARNTFQLALAYDTSETWAILSYRKLEFFSTSTSTRSVVGFNDRQGLLGQLINSIASTEEMEPFLNETNCGVAGTFAYKISDVLTSTGCGLTTQDPSFATRYGSQVGGTVIQVNNLPVCLDDEAIEVYCRFEGTAIGVIIDQGYRASREVVECISPFVGVGTETTVKVSYTTRDPSTDPLFDPSSVEWVEVLPFEYSSPFVGIMPAGSNGQPLATPEASFITVGSPFDIVWSAEGLLQVALQNIRVTSEDPNEVPPIDLTLEVLMWNGINFVPANITRAISGATTNQTSITISQEEFGNFPANTIPVVQLRVVARTGSRRIIATRSSDLLGVRSVTVNRRLNTGCQIDLAIADALYDCDELPLDEPELGCPGTAGEAQADPRFPDDGACTFPNGATGDCGFSVDVYLDGLDVDVDIGFDISACGCAAFHDGASGCFRGPGGGGSGTQCCYSGVDGQGPLINDPQLGAGTADCVAGDGTLWNSVGHFITDVAPYISCCVLGSAADCEEYFEERPPTGEENYAPEPPPARLFGDPHIRTTDGADYDFNGAGEFVGFCGVLSDVDSDFNEVISSCDPSENRLDGTRSTVSLHLRFAPSNPNDAGTVTVGVAVEDPLHRSGEFAIAIVPHPTRRVDVFDGRNLLSFPPVAGGYQTTMVLLDSGAKIERSSDLTQDEISIKVTMPSGLVLHLGEIRGVYLPSIKMPNVGITVGLLGFTDGDPSNDLTDSSGNIVILDTNATLAEKNAAVFELFGQTWRINTEQSSLFQAFSESAQAFANFDNPSYRPEFSPPSMSEDLQAQANEVCGTIGSEAIRVGCLFDIAATGDVELYGDVARSALQEEVTQVTVFTNNVPVFTQETLDQVMDGATEVGPGDSIEFSVDATDPDGDIITLTLGRNDGGLFTLQDADNAATLVFMGSVEEGRFVAFVMASDEIGSSLLGITIEVSASAISHRPSASPNASPSSVPSLLLSIPPSKSPSDLPSDAPMKSPSTFPSGLPSNTFSSTSPTVLPSEGKGESKSGKKGKGKDTTKANKKSKSGKKVKSKTKSKKAGSKSWKRTFLST